MQLLKKVLLISVLIFSHSVLAAPAIPLHCKIDKVLYDDGENYLVFSICEEDLFKIFGESSAESAHEAINHLIKNKFTTAILERAKQSHETLILEMVKPYFDYITKINDTDVRPK